MILYDYTRYCVRSSLNHGTFKESTHRAQRAALESASQRCGPAALLPRPERLWSHTKLACEHRPLLLKLSLFLQLRCRSLPAGRRRVTQSPTAVFQRHRRNLLVHRAEHAENQIVLRLELENLVRLIEHVRLGAANRAQVILPAEYLEKAEIEGWVGGGEGE